VDIGLRNALLAKAALQGKHFNTKTLFNMAVEEAVTTLKNNPNEGYHNKKVILLRALKIYKNLLKYYNTKKLYVLGGYTLRVKYINKFGNVPPNRWNKSDMIYIIVGNDANYIFKLIQKAAE